jgi:hypothetical protein
MDFTSAPGVPEQLPRRNQDIPEERQEQPSTIVDIVCPKFLPESLDVINPSRFFVQKGCVSPSEHFLPT